MGFIMDTASLYNRYCTDDALVMRALVTLRASPIVLPSHGKQLIQYTLQKYILHFRFTSACIGYFINKITFQAE